MPVRIEYRPAALSFDEFHRVDVECFPDEPISQEAFNELAAQDLWAAYDSDSLAGFSCVVRKPDMSWLSRIGVAAALRRRGICTRLMHIVIDHCKRIGLPDILLYVLSHNEDAIRLYHRFGFRLAESAYQFVLSDPLHAPLEASAEAVNAVPIVELAGASWPKFTREWADIAEMHKPPEQYVLVFRDAGLRNLGYCRLSPGFPGCFPLFVNDPSKNLQPVLRALRGYLLPEKDILKLTFSGDDLAEECAALGMRLNYRLLKMFRPGDTATSASGSPE